MEHFQKIELKKLRDFSAKFNVTFEFIRQNFKGLFSCLLFISVPFHLVGVIIISLYSFYIFDNVQQLSDSMASGVSPLSFLSGMFSFMFFGYIFVGLGYLLSSSLVYNYLKIYDSKDDPSVITVQEVWSLAKNDLITIFGAGVLVTIILFISVFLLFLPAIYLGVVFSLITPIIVLERKSIGDAFSRCFFLINDKWWSTFGLLFVAVLIQFIMGLVFNIPSYIISFMYDVNFTSGDVLAGFPLWYKIVTILTSSFSAVGASLLSVISYLAIAFQYFNLVERRESSGLLNKLEGFGKQEIGGDDLKETY